VATGALKGGRSPAFWVVIVAALGAGVFFRFDHLDRKLFWQDEAFTALRVSGHLERHYRNLFDEKHVAARDILAYQERAPHGSDWNVVTGLAAEDPHHGPLFYLLDRLWIDVAGSSISAYRGLSAALGTLALGFAFLFGRKLLGSSRGGGVLAALIAVSPFFILYSQQAREYALFAALALLASLLLLEARERGGAAWALYAAAAALGLYADPLFALLLAAHAVVVAACGRRRAPAVRGFLAACAAAAAAFSPWLINAASARSSIEAQLGWGTQSYPVRYVLEKWAFNSGALFFDYEFRDQRYAALVVPLLFLVAGAVVYVARFGRPLPRAFVAATCGIGFGAFLLRDLVTGSHFATIMRYGTVGWLGVACAVAAFLCAGLDSRDARLRAAAGAAFALVLACGLGSAWGRSGEVNWWSNNDQVAFQEVGALIDHRARPLVLCENRWHVPLILAHYVRPETEFLLFEGDDRPQFPVRGRTVFLVLPSPAIYAAIAARAGPNYRLVNVSPAAPTVIERFHAGLRRDARGYNEHGVAPDNALWELVPAAHGGHR
jgi:uncharacterized membrane protein